MWMQMGMRMRMFSAIEREKHERASEKNNATARLVKIRSQNGTEENPQ